VINRRASPFGVDMTMTVNRPGPDECSRRGPKEIARRRHDTVVPTFVLFFVVVVVVVVVVAVSGEWRSSECGVRPISDIKHEHCNR